MLDYTMAWRLMMLVIIAWIALFIDAAFGRFISKSLAGVQNINVHLKPFNCGSKSL